MIYSTSSHDSSIGTKRNRRGDELNMVDSRDDSHYTALMNEEEEEEEGTMSLGDFSMTSLGEFLLSIIVFVCVYVYIYWYHCAHQGNPLCLVSTH